MKIFDKKLRDTTYCKRVVLVFVSMLAITYCILVLGLHFGTYGVYLIGAISGGLWSLFWQMLFGQNPQKIWYPTNNLHYYLVITGVLALFVYLILWHPLPLK